MLRAEEAQRSLVASQHLLLVACRWLTTQAGTASLLPRAEGQRHKPQSPWSQSREEDPGEVTHQGHG